MRKIWSMLLVGFTATGCATVPSGEDPKGMELRAQASTVIEALAAYQKDHGEYPTSLQELAPKYLPNVPFEPGLRFDGYSGTLGYSYPAPWPRGGEVICVAKVVAPEWKCSE